MLASLYVYDINLLKKGKVMPAFKLLEIAEAKQRLVDGNVVLVDVRDPASFTADHIEGAYHLTNDSLKEFVDSVEFETPIFVICYHGNSSKGIAQYLVEQGYDDVYSVQGGMVLWRQLFPVN